MEAVQFVKKVGIHVATNLFKESEGCVGIRYAIGGYVKREDLKQIVEAWELVDNRGGLIGSKKYLKFLQVSVDVGLYHGLDNVNYETEIPLIRDAIACVEQCQ